MKKASSCVLASLKDSTYYADSRRAELLEGLFRSQEPLLGRTAHTKWGLYLLGPSLAAALLEILFEHLNDGG